jgi:predicted small secreted protein
MSKRILMVFCLVALLLAACGKTAATVGEDASFATACDKTNDGKRIALTGYLRFPDSFTGDQSVVLRMYEADDFNGKPIGVQIEFGKEANQAEPIADQYKDEDLQVHLTNGQTAPFGTKVKVSGKVYFPIVGQEFDCALDNPLVELAP